MALPLLQDKIFSQQEPLVTTQNIRLNPLFQTALGGHRQVPTPILAEPLPQSQAVADKKAIADFMAIQTQTSLPRLPELAFRKPQVVHPQMVVKAAQSTDVAAPESTPKICEEKLQ